MHPCTPARLNGGSGEAVRVCLGAEEKLECAPDSRSTDGQVLARWIVKGEGSAVMGGGGETERKGAAKTKRERSGGGP